MYGFASGPTERTSTRADFSLPMGMRIIDPRSTAEALIWFGASKCGSKRRYAFTLAFNNRQMSLPCDRILSTKLHANGEIFSCPLGSQNRFLPSFVMDTLVCIPEPL